MKTALRFFVFAIVAALAVPSLHAATYFVPSDAELIQSSDDIVVATALTSVVERDARGSIVTRYTLRIEEALKGGRSAGQHFELVERGGVLDGKYKMIFGTPEYEPGVRYLIFADTDLDGISRTHGLALGQFFFAKDRGHDLLLRAEVMGFDNNLESHVERARDAQGFVEYIRGIVAQKIAPEPQYFVDAARSEWTPASQWKVGANATRTSFLMQSGGMGFRWQNASQSWVRNGTVAAPADSPAAINSTSQGFAEWNGTGTDIDFSDSGVNATALGGLETDDGFNTVLFGDPNGEINGAAGVGGVYGDITYVVGGETFIRVFEGDLVIEGGTIAQNCLNSVMTHEMGHTLGFRHSNTPPAGGISTSDAIMNSSVSCSWNGVLKAYDIEAAQTVYGSGPVCNPAGITAQPQTRNIGLGSSTTLSVSTTGTAPLTFQWFEGASGVTTTPATGTGATTNTLTVVGSAVGTFNYWVRVSNACGTPVNSAAGTVNVTCSVPVINTQPASPTVNLGQGTSLTVASTGATAFQWFRGDTGNDSDPVVGATSSTLTLSAAALPTVGTYKFWVRVSNTCPSGSVNSNTATVTVNCTAPVINTNPTNKSISEGGNTSLTVVATGSSLTFQWFIGASGDTSNPVAGGTSSTLNVSPATTTTYWVRVSGACGTPQNSAAATVTVTPCAPITVNQPTATGSGSSKTLSVVATSTATPLTFAWFRGNTPGFGGTPAGTGASVNVNVTAVTSFWVRVTNSCGRVEFSGLITVAPCTLPVISAQPQDQSINFNQTATLTVGSSSTGLTVRWYRGLVGDKTNQVGTGLTFTTPPLTSNTQYWAEVSNSCGPVNSRQVTVTVQQITELVPLLNARFFVQVRYVNQFENPPREGKLLGRSLFNTPLSETAIFTFGDPLVVELMVRLSDARPFENKIHVFLGGLSDVEFFVVVTDSLTGTVREYRKPPNQLIGTIDRATFPGGTSLEGAVDALVAEKATLRPSANAEVSTIRLLNNRFEVRMRYRNQFTNPPGTGYMNTRSIASSPTTETAVFFFDENVGSVEWMVRFSDARPFANRIDMFHGGLSDVEFTVEVHDTQTGERREYAKGPFSLVGLVDRENWQP